MTPPIDPTPAHRQGVLRLSGHYLMALAVEGDPWDEMALRAKSWRDAVEESDNRLAKFRAFWPDERIVLREYEGEEELAPATGDDPADCDGTPDLDRLVELAEAVEAVLPIADGFILTLSMMDAEHAKTLERLIDRLRVAIDAIREGS